MPVPKAPKKLLRSGAGFTLVELMVTMAITAILSTIVFTGLANERNRTSVRQAADQLQVDLQGLQNNVQTGQVAPTTSCLGGTFDRRICTATDPIDCPVCQLRPPAGFGVSATEGNTSYLLFADMPGGLTGGYDTTAGNSDATVRSVALSPNLVIRQITCTNCSGADPSSVDVVFSGFRGDAGFRITPNASADSVSIVLKHTRLNICYAVSIQKIGGIVTRKEFRSTCP